jgi:hypothetical protein
MACFLRILSRVEVHKQLNLSESDVSSDEIVKFCGNFLTSMRTSVGVDLDSSQKTIVIQITQLIAEKITFLRRFELFFPLIISICSNYSRDSCKIVLIKQPL